MTSNILQRFLDEHDYDVRKTGNGRWIDQKCALDAVCFVADCIVDYIQNGGRQPFQSPDIWHSEYAIQNVQHLFGKPDPTIRTTLDEYNKFFRQPMKMLAAAGVLREDGVVHNTIQFSVENMDVLEYAATLNTYMPMWIAPILLVACFVFGIVGGLIGKAICKKHFQRAGIA